MRGLWNSLAIRLNMAPYPFHTGIFAIPYLAYSLTFLLFYPSAGMAIIALSMAPAALAGWLFGLIGGALGGVMTILINMLLLAAFGHLNLLAPHLTLIYGMPMALIGLLVGWLSETRGLLHQRIESQQATEERLRLNEQRYRRIVEDQPDLICRFLPDGTLTYVNEAYARYFGERPEHLVGQRLEALFTREEREGLARKLAGLTPEHPTATSEHPTRTPDGSPAWIYWTDHAIFDGAGQLVEYQSVGRNMTERKQAELRLIYTNAQLQQAYRDLEESRRRLYALFEYSLDPILFADNEGRYVNVNPAACNLTGYSWEELCQMTLWDLTPPEQVPALKENWQQFLDEGSFSGEFPIICKDGSHRYVEFRGVANITPGLHVSINRDITERKAADAHMQYLINHDGLTRLYNRRYFESAYEQMIEQGQLPITLIICDMDELKKINDQQGHLKGDEMLKKAAQLLQTAFRGEGVVARLGGDEFAVLLPQTPREAGEQALLRLRALVNAPAEEGPVPQLSCGAATLEAGQDPRMVFHQADLAMLDEKNRRRHKNARAEL